MYASIEGSTYIENTIDTPTSEVYSHEHTMNAELPDLAATNGTLLTFETALSVIALDPIVIFSTEYPEGIETVATTVALPLITIDPALVLTAPITEAYRMPVLVPDVYSVASSLEGRVLLQDTPLVYTSAVEASFVGVGTMPDMVSVDDTISIMIAAVPTTKTILSVVESGTAPAVTYTIGYDAGIADASVDAIIPSRVTEDLDIEVPDVIGTTTRIGSTLVIEWAPKVNPKYLGTPAVNPLDDTWMFIGRKIVSPIEWTINEPFVCDYKQKI